MGGETGSWWSLEEAPASCLPKPAALNERLIISRNLKLEGHGQNQKSLPCLTQRERVCRSSSEKFKHCLQANTPGKDMKDKCQFCSSQNGSVEDGDEVGSLASSARLKALQ